MPQTELTRISIYVPKSRHKEKLLERLQKLGVEQDRTMNYMVIQAILEYVKRQEKK